MPRALPSPLGCPVCSSADVAVLRQLPFLEQLNLRRQVFAAGDEHSPQLLQMLRAALPDCEVLV